MNKAKIGNTILVWMLLLATVITSPLLLLPRFRTTIYWKYLWTHRCFVFRVRETSGKKTQEVYNNSLGLSVAAYGISMIGLSPVANMGILYHELGHCVDPRAFNSKGRGVHFNDVPDASEIAADRYAVRSGYGQELLDALEPCAGTCPDIPERLRLIRQAMDDLNRK
jgi:hypothetical protein